VAGLLVKQGGAEGAEQDAADLAAAAVNAEALKAAAEELRKLAKI